MYLPVNIVRYDGEEIDGHLREFEAFLRVDLDEQPATVKEHLRYVKGFLAGGYPEAKEGVRAFLVKYSEKPASKANALKTLRRYFRDFLNRPDAVSAFKFPRGNAAQMPMPSRAQLRAFHGCLDLKHRAVFLVLASSGLRRGEVLSLARGRSTW